MRTANSVRNVKYAVLGQFFAIIINLIARIVFVKVLSAEYLGLSGLFSNILTILCLSELGFGTAMSYQLYKPLADNDTEKVKSLLKLYKKIYIIIGIIILGLGCLCIPVYPYLINELPDIKNIDLIYILFVINTASSYFFAYKRILVTADQKQYISTFYKYSFYFLLNILQIIELLLFKNYILFLCIQIIMTLFENFFLSIKVNKIYPYLKEKNVKNVSDHDIKDMKFNVKAMFFHKFGGVVLNSTDNIIISKYLGLASVGIYSNYLLITNALNSIVSQIFNSVVASIGNLDVTSGKNSMTKVFDKVFFLNFWIYCVCTICLISLFNPFINLWLGSEYTLPLFSVIVISINFYIFGMRKTAMSFREATGNYYVDRISPIAESILNICLSIFLVKYYGLAGVVLGTIISSLLTNFWCEPYVICKKSLNKSIFEYLKVYIKYTLICIIIAFITIFISNLIPSENIVMFLVKSVVAFIIPNLFLLILFRKNKYFKFYVSLIASKILKINRKGN